MRCHLWGCRPAAPRPQLAPPIIIDVYCVSAGCTVDGGRSGLKTQEMRPQLQPEVAGTQVRSPAPPHDHALGLPVQYCTEGVSGISDCLGDRGASGRCFSASTRPTSLDNLLTPSPFAQYGLLRWVPGASRPTQISFLRGVSAIRVQISHPHPSLSRDRVLRRFLAVHGCAFWCVRDAQKARGAGQKKTNARRAWQSGSR